MADQPSVLHVTGSAPPLSPNANAESMAPLPPKFQIHNTSSSTNTTLTSQQLHYTSILFSEMTQDLTTPPAQPLPPSERSHTRYLSQDSNLPTAIPGLLPESSSGQKRANLVWHCKRNKAQATQPITAMTFIYKHELNYKLIDCHKLFKQHRRVGSNSSPQTYQKLYHTHWGPMTIEKWAIAIFTAAGSK